MSDYLMLLESASDKSVLKRSQVSAEPSWQLRLLYATAVATLAGVALGAHYLIPLAWNVEATRTLQSLNVPGLHELMRLISGFGNAPKVIAITVVALLACNKRREAFWLTWSGLGGWFVSMQLKHFFAAPRPTADVVAVFHQWPNGSFPSGHLVFYICYFGFLFFVAREELPHGSLVRRFALILLSFPIALVGFSRVYLGEHWTSDIPGSYLLGGLWLALSLKLYRGWTRSRGRQRDWFFPYRTIGS
jgi:membrane-associated phospholipid phosphatase